MTTETQLREAVREGTDWIRIARLLRRAGYVQQNSDGWTYTCPHCGEYDTGHGAWTDGMSGREFALLRDAGFGLPYICQGNEGGDGMWLSVGCGELFVGRIGDTH